MTLNKQDASSIQISGFDSNANVSIGTITITSSNFVDALNSVFTYTRISDTIRSQYRVGLSSVSVYASAYFSNNILYSKYAEDDFSNFMRISGVHDITYSKANVQILYTTSLPSHSTNEISCILNEGHYELVWCWDYMPVQSVFKSIIDVTEGADGQLDYISDTTLENGQSAPTVYAYNGNAHIIQRMSTYSN